MRSRALNQLVLLARLARAVAEPKPKSRTVTYDPKDVRVSFGGVEMDVTEISYSRKGDVEPSGEPHEYETFCEMTMPAPWP